MNLRRRRRRAAVLLVLAASAFAPVAPARADEGDATVITYGPDPGVEAEASGFEDGDEGAGSAAGGGDGGSDGSEDAGRAAPEPVAISLHNCIPIYGTGGVPIDSEFSDSAGGDCSSYARPDDDETSEAGKAPAPSPEVIAEILYDHVVALAPGPMPRSVPARAAMAGLTTYFFVDPPPPVAATASVPGLTVTAEAHPERYLWDFGDGSTRATNHPGRAWSPTRPGDIAHVYERRGRYAVEVVVVWRARWNVNGGAWTDLGTFETRGEKQLPVRALVAVLTRTR